MGLARIEHIVSVSSEDPDYPAQNLLKAGSLGSSNIKWTCQTPSPRQISVVIQLSQSHRINRIDVENENSAFIEILAGRLCTPGDFKTILDSSCLMTVKEAKFGNNPNKFRVFQKEDLCGDVAAEKWDRIKIVCSQPFNSTLTYGLRFIGLHVDSCVQPHETVTLPDPDTFLPKLITKDDRDFYNSLTRGLLRIKKSPASELSGAAAARSATSSPRTITLPSALRFKSKVKANRSNSSPDVISSGQRAGAPVVDHRKTLIDSESDSTDEEYREVKKRKQASNARGTHDSCMNLASFDAVHKPKSSF